MKTVTTGKIKELRDAEPEGGEAYRVYDSCLMRRSGRMSMRKIADKVEIPYQTLRRRLIACNKRREATRHPNTKYVDRCFVSQMWDLTPSNTIAVNQYRRLDA